MVNLALQAYRVPQGVQELQVLLALREMQVKEVKLYVSVLGFFLLFKFSFTLFIKKLLCGGLYIASPIFCMQPLQGSRGPMGPPGRAGKRGLPVSSP